MSARKKTSVVKILVYDACETERTATKNMIRGPFSNKTQKAIPRFVRRVLQKAKTDIIVYV